MVTLYDSLHHLVALFIFLKKLWNYILAFSFSFSTLHKTTVHSTIFLQNIVVYQVNAQEPPVQWPKQEIMIVRQLVNTAF